MLHSGYIGLFFQTELMSEIYSKSPVGSIECFSDQKLASGHNVDSWTNKPAKCDDRVPPLISLLQ